MGLFSAHSADSDDPLLRPIYGWQAQGEPARLGFDLDVFLPADAAALASLALLFTPTFRGKIGGDQLRLSQRQHLGALASGNRRPCHHWPRRGNLQSRRRILGHRTIISQDAYFCSATHDYQTPDFTYITKLIRTGPQVWICARAIVLPGVHCKEGSVLGAGSVATRNLEEWTVYAGNPAVAVRERNRFDMPWQKHLKTARPLRTLQ